MGSVQMRYSFGLCIFLLIIGMQGAAFGMAYKCKFYNGNSMVSEL